LFHKQTENLEQKGEFFEATLNTRCNYSINFSSTAFCSLYMVLVLFSHILNVLLRTLALKNQREKRQCWLCCTYAQVIMMIRLQWSSGNNNDQVARMIIKQWLLGCNEDQFAMMIMFQQGSVCNDDHVSTRIKLQSWSGWLADNTIVMIRLPNLINQILKSPNGEPVKIMIVSVLKSYKSFYSKWTKSKKDLHAWQT